MPSKQASKSCLSTKLRPPLLVVAFALLVVSKNWSCPTLPACSLWYHILAQSSSWWVSESDRGPRQKGSDTRSSRFAISPRRALRRSPSIAPRPRLEVAVSLIVVRLVHRHDAGSPRRTKVSGLKSGLGAGEFEL